MLKNVNRVCFSQFVVFFKIPYNLFIPATSYAIHQIIPYKCIQCSFSRSQVNMLNVTNSTILLSKILKIVWIQILLKCPKLELIYIDNCFSKSLAMIIICVFSYSILSQNLQLIAAFKLVPLPAVTQYTQNRMACVLEIGHHKFVIQLP